MVKYVTVHGKCSAISDGDWQVFPFIYLEDYVIQRQMNKHSGFNAEQIEKDRYVVGQLDMYHTKVLLYRTMVLLACPTKVRR